ncbi:MAG: gluconate 2-dehydrogenase subunit 3 family protein [Opitutae bacterium]|nr:gluconate 2-dehydrogenase subunit 3 family protein [Opitutae bacterium]
MDRRTALKWMLLASASAALGPRLAVAGEQVTAPRGYGTDLDLHKIHPPGELWPLTFTAEQRRVAAALSDVIIPADADSPSASSVGVVDFLDEWISAPYPDQRKDRPVIMDGLAWLETEARRRFDGRPFVELNAAEHTKICDDICDNAQAASGFERAARFFARFRNLVAAGYYTTPAGMKALGYVGNTPLATFDGPSSDVLRRAGLA